MLSFESDYIKCAHPAVLQALVNANAEALGGYGEDVITARAKDKIRAACGKKDAAVYFLTGGTQTNAFVIDTTLKAYEGVVAAHTGHVSLHEGGAIERGGHKVLTVEGKAGKLPADGLRKLLEDFYADGNHEHMVFPGMVYISHPTEYGTLYTKAELEILSGICREYRLPLFIDGARLGYGLMSYETDVTLRDIADLADVFYIGGTKVGALCGEALVYPGGEHPAHMAGQLKQHGALLAKGFLNGIQFDALFTDGLYEKISRHAIDMAVKLKEMFLAKGYELFLDSPTNQQFVILSNDKMAALAENVRFSFWEVLDADHTVVRFAASWSTTEEELAALSALL